ncbi:hypothetical protein OsJ_21011 [Oryza sativa Japonica Group]|uniref:Uncharacterized protein n=1 Tax=Oryza sativa subsp. japonica TaxID=39947 RepID=B9FST0_ORYSJ|nr:hypothetical protein OsJ_21011 [Oryza sativa Japonica Group]
MVGEVDDVVGDGIAWVVRLHGDEAAVDVEETEKLRRMLTAWIRWRRWHKRGWRKRESAWAKEHGGEEVAQTREAGERR